MTIEKNRGHRWSRSWPEFRARLFAAVSSPAWWAVEITIVLLVLVIGGAVGVWTARDVVWMGPMFILSCVWWAGICGGAPFAADEQEVVR